MSEPIKVCIDKRLPDEAQLEASNRAIAETPENLPTVHVRPLPGVYSPLTDEIAVLTGKKWQNGRTIRIRFLDGTPSLHARVEAMARQWELHANLRLDFGNHADPDVRIAFTPGGSWSYLGTDALGVPPDEPTMNYGWLTDSSSDDELSRVVLHEFGHALSAIHEHQSPEANIPWDTEAVYAYYSGPPNNWTREQIDHNIFLRYSRTITNFSAFDPASIMLYAIPNELTIGDYEVGWNRVLSETDKSFMRTVYPRGATQATELGILPPYAQASIGAHGEQDLFTFTVLDAGTFRVQTLGQTDVVVSLLGPDSQSVLVAEDDDSGAGSNAQITAQLSAGQYYIRVRHVHPTGTGSYQIGVQSVG